MSTTDIDAILSRGNSRRRWFLLAGAAAVIAAVVVVVVLLTRPDEEDVVFEPERVESAMGRLSTQVDLSGSAVSERSATPGFDVGGVVASVAVAEGSEVREGDSLASLDDADAQRRVQTAEVQLELAQLRLENLLADPEPAAIASANQAIVSAKSQVVSAEQALELLSEPPSASDLRSAEQAVASALRDISSSEQALELLAEPPSAADLASAEQAVASALRDISSAEQSLALLSEPPSASDLKSAEQAVATALRDISSAEQALTLLSEPPSASDMRSAEQAVATALRDISNAEQALALLSEPPSASDMRSAEQAVATALRDISNAEQALDDLTAGPTDAEVSASRSAATQAHVTFADATRIEKESKEVLTDASEEFCERYSGLIPSDEVIRSICEAVLPLSEAQMDVLEESFEDRSAAYENLGTALIDANLGFVSAHADRDSALSSLASAEETLDELLTPPSEEDLFQAQQAIDAARAGHASAVARLEDLQTQASEEDVFQAEQAIDAARAGHASAVARLEDLQTQASEEDVFQAQQAVEAAKASHASAVARLEDLQTQASEEDVYQAEQAVEAAKASHTAAVARLDDLQTQASEEDVYQAEQAVEAARASHAAAEAGLEELRAATDEGEFEQARAALESAQASLASAQAQYDELVAGPSENAIAQQRQDVRLAEISLEEARAALADLTVTAPFDGVVEAVNVLPGDRIAAGFNAFTLYTSDRMLIELTVTEEELLELEIGQIGTASFDAIEGTEYPVRVESISRVPNAEQGVVTYDVEARILTGNDGDAVSGATRRNARPGGGGGFGAGGFGGGFGGGAGGSPFAGFQLPEGVTQEDVTQAIINGDPLPEGVELPAQVMQMIETLRASGQLARIVGGLQVPPAQQGDEERAGDNAERPLPAPGMSASVTILTEIRDPAVLAPVSAVRQLDGRWFVSVQTTTEIEGSPPPEGAGIERVYVEIGESDGNQVEILSGIETGAILLVGADNAGVAFTATMQQPQVNPEFGGFGPGGPR